MTTKCLSVAIIGAGDIAGGYDRRRADHALGIYTHAGAYRESGQFSLKMVFDVNARRARDFAHYWRIERTCENLDEICAARHDVVSVCTPDDTHYGIIKRLLQSRCCTAIFSEKPLAADFSRVEELASLAEDAGVRLVVNHQRRHDPVHRQIRDRIQQGREKVLSASAHYMKGLRHIGVTMVNTLTYLCGYPQAVLTFNRVLNPEINEHSFEFVLYYDGFTAAVKTTDAERFQYNYHIFEIDLLFADGRVATVGNSRYVRETPVGGYAYSGVKMLDETRSTMRQTDYDRSMCRAVDYLYGITAGTQAHDLNTSGESYNDMLILSRIAESYDSGCEKLIMDHDKWKK